MTILNFFRAALLSTLACAAPLPALTAEPGVSADSIRLGQTLGLDSIWKDGAGHYQAGLLAYFNQVNSEGGVHGRKITVQHLEDHYVTQEAVANIHEFGQRNNVFALVAIGGTPMTLAAMPLLEQYKLPLVGALTGADATRAFNKYLFHTRTTYKREVEKMIEHLKTVGMTRVAVVYQDNAFGKECVEAASREGQRLGVSVVGTFSQPVNGSIPSDTIRGLAKATPQAVLMFVAPAVVADLVKGYKKETGYTIPKPWVLSVTSPKRLHELLGEEAVGIAVTRVVPTPKASSSDLAREYAEVSARHDSSRALTHEGLEGFLTAKVVVEALRRVGPNPNRAAFVAALESFGERNLGGVPFRYSRTDHSGPRYVEVTMIGKGGQVVR